MSRYGDDDPHGYDPERERKAKARDLFDRLEQKTDEKGEPQQIGKAAKIPKVSATKLRLISAGTEVRSQAPELVGFSHSVLCQVGLPYKPVEGRVWERKSGTSHLKITAGDAMDKARGELVELPLPHGEKPRLILMHLTSEAIRTGSRMIDVGDSLTAFVRALGLHTKGRDIKAVRQQLARLSASRMVLGMVKDGRAVTVKTDIIDSFSLWDGEQPTLWPSQVELSERYAASLAEHAVPLDMRAVAALGHSAMALDVYTWLTQRLHRVPKGKPQFIPWTALHQQFGMGYARIRAFREFFIDTLHQVKTVYPAARFDVNDKGMTAWTSAPPVSKRLVQISKGTVIEGQATEIKD